MQGIYSGKGAQSFCFRCHKRLSFWFQHVYVSNLLYLKNASQLEGTTPDDCCFPQVIGETETQRFGRLGSCVHADSLRTSAFDLRL